MVKKTNNLWNTKEVAEYYGVSTVTVQNWVKNNGCPCYVIGPKKFKYDPELVKTWMKERSAKLIAGNYKKTAKVDNDNG